MSALQDPGRSATRPAGSLSRIDASAATPVVLSVDRIRCDGYGMCAELLPEMIDLDDWGYPILRAGGVRDDLLGHARRAVEACPVLALRLRTVAIPVSGRG